MAFTATRVNQFPQPEGEFMKEKYDCVNTSGSTGGTITTSWIKNIQYVNIGPGITEQARTATTVQILMDANSRGGVEIVGV